MKVLLSSIGSRGDVQPIVALAVECKQLGHDASLCVAPNFKEWIESYGVECIPIGPDLKKMTGATVPGKPALPSREQLRALADQMVRDQFTVITEAARGCDVIVGAGALQIATRSIAEAQKIPYIFAAYCPAVLPSSEYPPPKMGGHYSFTLPHAENDQLWEHDEQEFNRFLPVLNEQRSKLSLAPISSVRPHVFTDRPWLAADPTLAPVSPRAGMEVVQTGAWLLDNDAPLPHDLEDFLTSGPPPVYLGFGSMRASERTADILLWAARKVGLRAILSQGWAQLAPTLSGADFHSIGDVDHAKLFPRVAAVVHHGGSGTTTAAARAGKPQAIVPHNYDQFYWAHRITQLGIGVSGPTRDDLTKEALVEALRVCLHSEMTARAQALAEAIALDGASLAARRLVSEFG
jgi:vancomycin aglycone glucosyltransferase